MKTLVAIPCLLNGGTERQTLMLSNALQDTGYEVIVLCYFEFDNAIVRDFEESGAKVKLLNISRKTGFLKIIHRLKDEIQSLNPNVVHVQYMAPGALPIIAARLAGVKRVFATVHQPYTESHGRLVKLILRIASLFTTKFIAVSRNAEKSWFGSSHLLDETVPLGRQKRHFTIYNSVDAGLIKETIEASDLKDLKDKLTIREGVLVIGAVSRLRHEKGIDILVEAYNLIVKEGAETHLLLVGSGPEEYELKKKVQKMGLASCVTFCGDAGWKRAMQLMALMNIVVVPSRFEGFGLTAAEAMAAGKPVVAADTTGLKEVAVDEETAILFPVDSILALKHSLQKLVNDPNLRYRLGSAGQKRVAENFSAEIFARKTKFLYSYYLINSYNT